MTRNQEFVDVEGSPAGIGSEVSQESAVRSAVPAESPPDSPETPGESAILDRWHGVTTRLPPELALDEEPDLDPAWRITTDEHAEWALRKLAGARSRVAQINAQAQAWINRIQSWAGQELVKPVEQAEFRSNQLEAWARERREADPKLKTIRLPSGTISSKAGRGSITVVDEEAAIAFIQAWCDEMERPVEDLLRLKVEVKKDALREILVPEALRNGLALIEDGEEVPGISVEPPSVSYTVKTAEA